MNTPLVIMPVKDSISLAERAIRAVISSGHQVCIYDDYSAEDSVSRLLELQQELHFEMIHLSQLTTHQSPNYHTILIHARQRALAEQRPIVIVESDVIIQKDTIHRLLQQTDENIGMVGAVTTDETGKINFPYRYTKATNTTIRTNKRLSFCCTMLSIALLKKVDFEHELNPAKQWYDVPITHLALRYGFHNYLMTDNPVIHYPHSSRPWKQLKYTHPLLYYIQKIMYGRDKI